MTTVWPLVLAAVFRPLSVRRCQRLGRCTSGPGEAVFRLRPGLRWT